MQVLKIEGKDDQNLVEMGFFFSPRGAGVYRFRGAKGAFLCICSFLYTTNITPGVLFSRVIITPGVIFLGVIIYGYTVTKFSYVFVSVRLSAAKSIIKKYP